MILSKCFSASLFNFVHLFSLCVLWIFFLHLQKCLWKTLQQHFHVIGILFMHECWRNTMGISHEIPMEVEIECELSSMEHCLNIFYLHFCTISNTVQINSKCLLCKFLFPSLRRYGRSAHTPFTSMIVQFLIPTTPTVLLSDKTCTEMEIMLQRMIKKNFRIRKYRMGNS